MDFLGLQLELQGSLTVFHCLHLTWSPFTISAGPFIKIDLAEDQAPQAFSFHGGQEMKAEAAMLSLLWAPSPRQSNNSSSIKVAAQSSHVGKIYQGIEENKSRTVLLRFHRYLAFRPEAPFWDSPTSAEAHGI